MALLNSQVLRSSRGGAALFDVETHHSPRQAAPWRGLGAHVTILAELPTVQGEVHLIEQGS